MVGRKLCIHGILGKLKLKQSEKNPFCFWYPKNYKEPKSKHLSPIQKMSEPKP